MFFQRPVGGDAHLGKDVRVGAALQYFTECDARGQPKVFLSADRLPQELVDESQTLAVVTVFAEPMKGLCIASG